MLSLNTFSIYNGYKNDERYWNINLLNKWFALSSILFLISIVWMFLDDNDDEFKIYQRNFRKLETQINQQKLNTELNKIIDSRIEHENIYNLEKSKYSSFEFELDSLNILLELLDNQILYLIKLFNARCLTSLPLYPLPEIIK